MSVTSPYNPAAGDRRNGSPAGPATVSGSPPAATGDRLPRPPRRRRPGFAALAVLLIVGSAAAAGLLAMQLDTRKPVLVARHDIGAGQQISRDDLAISRVAASGLDLIAANDVNAVIGKYAAQTIPGGRLVDSQMLTDNAPLTAGKVAIGIPLKTGTTPASGVQPGDKVKVVWAKQDKGELLTSEAVVASVSSGGGGGTFGGGGDGRVATIIVPDDDNGATTSAIAAAAYAGQAVLVLVERGGAG